MSQPSDLAEESLAEGLRESCYKMLGATHFNEPVLRFFPGKGLPDFIDDVFFTKCATFASTWLQHSFRNYFGLTRYANSLWPSDSVASPMGFAYLLQAKLYGEDGTCWNFIPF